jgi:hypothetical protein
VRWWAERALAIGAVSLAGCGYHVPVTGTYSRWRAPTPPAVEQPQPVKAPPVEQPPPVAPPVVAPPAPVPPPVVAPAPAPAPQPLPVDYLVSWAAPTANTDGTPLSNLAGYRLYYWVGMAKRTVTDIPDPSALTYTIQNLGHGTWSFCMTAYNTEQTESSCSDTVTVTK